MTSSRPRVAVLVLNYNGRWFLESCLKALDAQHYRDFAVTVIDNGSTDGSVEWLTIHRPEIAVAALGANLGFAGAYDRVVRGEDRALVALLNNDAEPDPGWLGALVRALDRDPTAAAATSRIRFTRDPSVLNHAGGAISPLGSGFDIGFGEPDGPRFDHPRRCGSPSGAACLLRRADFIEAGGFDPHYFAWFEDTDLGWRLWLQGRGVLYVPDATVRHHYGATGGGRASPLRVYHCQKNRLANATKNLGLSSLVIALLAGLAYDLLRTAGFLLRPGGFPAALAIWRGTVAYLRWLPHLLAERRQIQRRRRLRDADLRRAGALASWRAALRALRGAEVYRRRP